MHIYIYIYVWIYLSLYIYLSNLISSNLIYLINQISSRLISSCLSIWYTYACVFVYVLCIVCIYIYMYIVCDAWNSCPGALSNYSSLFQVPLKSCSIAVISVEVNPGKTPNVRIVLVRRPIVGHDAGQETLYRGWAEQQSLHSWSAANRLHHSQWANGQTIFGTQPRGPRNSKMDHYFSQLPEIYQNISTYFDVEHENRPLPSNLEASNMSPPGIYTSLQTAKSKTNTYFNT